MRFGFCAGPENLEMAARLGFDYLECSVTGVESMGEGDFAALRQKVEKSPVKIERFNVLFPGTIRLIGPEADHAAIRAYLERAFPRVKALGGAVVVFGSGRSRAFPAEMAYSAAFCELVAVTRLIGEVAAKYGLVIAIEPLNRDETNCVNSVREGAMLQGAVNLPSIQLLADLYHVLKEKEPFENIVAAKKLAHTHIALLEGRVFPTIADADVKAFFRALKEAGYNGTMSIEGKAGNLEADAVAALNVLRKEAQ